MRGDDTGTNNEIGDAVLNIRNFLQILIIAALLASHSVSASAHCEAEEKAVSELKQELSAALLRASSASSRKNTNGSSPVRRGDEIGVTHLVASDEVDYRKARSVQRNAWRAWRKAKIVRDRCEG